MKANELRIGNWVLEYFDDNYITTQVNSFKIHQFEIGSMAPLKPIQIIEEWMLKFGFEDCNDPEFNKYANAKMYYRGFLVVYQFESSQIGIAKLIKFVTWEIRNDRETQIN